MLLINLLQSWFILYFVHISEVYYMYTKANSEMQLTWIQRIFYWRIFYYELLHTFVCFWLMNCSHSEPRQEQIERNHITMAWTHTATKWRLFSASNQRTKSIFGFRRILWRERAKKILKCMHIAASSRKKKRRLNSLTFFRLFLCKLLWLGFLFGAIRNDCIKVTLLRWTAL